VRWVIIAEPWYKANGPQYLKLALAQTKWPSMPPLPGYSRSKLATGADIPVAPTGLSRGRGGSASTH